MSLVTRRHAAFVEVLVQGVVDVERSRAQVLRLATEVEGEHYPLLLDYREAVKEESYADVYRVMQLVAELRDHFAHRIALLGRYAQDFEKYPFAEYVGQLEGLETRAFLDRDAAVAWLEAAGPERERPPSVA